LEIYDLCQANLRMIIHDRSSYVILSIFLMVGLGKCTKLFTK